MDPARVLAQRAIKGPAKARMQRFDSADAMLNQASTSSSSERNHRTEALPRAPVPTGEAKEAATPASMSSRPHLPTHDDVHEKTTAASTTLVRRALRGEPLGAPPKMQRFDSADYFSELQRTTGHHPAVRPETPETHHTPATTTGSEAAPQETEDLLQERAPPAGGPLLAATTCCVGIVVRYAVSLHPYSGESDPPRFGDYEAHRHWMALTLNRPLREWYRHDVAYWGLDYPPLMAYAENALGWLSFRVEPASVSLSVDDEASRGYETPTHRAFMRATVLALDVVCVVVPLLLLHARKGGAKHRRRHYHRSLGVALLSPAPMLVDHGHFQYNCVPLGLTLWAAYWVRNDCLRAAAACFSLACNAKQTALYFAPAVFFELLARCCLVSSKSSSSQGTEDDSTGTTVNEKTKERSSNVSSFLTRLAGVAVATVATFAACWAPLVAKGGTADAVARLFPVGRGIFQDKVGNFWYSAQVALRARDRLSQPTLVVLAALLTFAFAVVPCGLAAWRRVFGHYATTRPPHDDSVAAFLSALHVSALGFFLFSYHVHEKAVLVPLAPLLARRLATLDDDDDDDYGDDGHDDLDLGGGGQAKPFVTPYAKRVLADAYAVAFHVVAAASLLPLLCFERLRLAYAATQLLFALLVDALLSSSSSLFTSSSTDFYRRLARPGFRAVALAFAALHLVPTLLAPPPRFPDLFHALTALASAALFGLAYLVALADLLLTRGQFLFGDARRPSARAASSGTTAKGTKKRQ